MASTRREQALRRLVLDLAGYRCAWCGGVATQADHWPIARSAGGPDTLANLIASCQPCNASKGAGPRPPHPTQPALPSRAW